MTTEKKRKRVQLHCKDKSLTKQSFRQETNINSVMSRYEKTGVIDYLNNNDPQYGDFSTIQSYQESLNQIMLAQNMFDALPAQIRKQFENDPVLFVEFAQNPENHEIMVQMGLAEPKEALKDENPSPPPPKEEKDPPAPKQEATEE